MIHNDLKGTAKIQKNHLLRGIPENSCFQFNIGLHLPGPDQPEDFPQCGDLRMVRVLLYGLINR